MDTLQQVLGYKEVVLLEAWSLLLSKSSSLLLILQGIQFLPLMEICNQMPLFQEAIVA